MVLKPATRRSQVQIPGLNDWVILAVPVGKALNGDFCYKFALGFILHMPCGCEWVFRVFAIPNMEFDTTS